MNFKQFTKYVIIFAGMAEVVTVLLVALGFFVYLVARIQTDVGFMFGSLSTFALTIFLASVLYNFMIHYTTLTWFFFSKTINKLEEVK